MRPSAGDRPRRERVLDTLERRLEFREVARHGTLLPQVVSGGYVIPALIPQPVVELRTLRRALGVSRSGGSGIDETNVLRNYI
jgi:hypothetical protein